jgi:hypothetical protein
VSFLASKRNRVAKDHRRLQEDVKAPRMVRIGRFECLEPRRVGPSDNIALGQPRVAVELLVDADPGADQRHR